MKNYTVEELSEMSYKNRKIIYKEHEDFLISIGYKNAKVKARKRRRVLENYISLIHYCKNKGGCADCGEQDFRFLEFNHINPEEKSNTISRLVNYKKSKMMEEVAKCEVLCLKCHRKRTQDDLMHYRLFNKEFCIANGLE